MNKSANEIINELEMRVAQLEKQSHLSVRDSSKKVMKALEDLDRAMNQMDESLHSMPSFTSNDRYYKKIAERWYQLRNNLNTVKGEVEYIKGAY